MRQRNNNEKVYRLTESQILDICREASKNPALMENRFGRFGKFLAGAAVAGATMFGASSCTPINEPTYNETTSNYSGFQTDMDKAKAAMQKDERFVNAAKSELENEEVGSFMIYSKLDHTDNKTYAPNCKGDYIFCGILKRGEGDYCAGFMRCKYVETYDEFDKYDVITEALLKERDKSNAMEFHSEEATVDQTRDVYGNCKASPYTKFFEEWMTKDGGWENGMERVYDAWISIDKEYFVQTIKCDDVDKHKFHVENHQVKDRDAYWKYGNHEKGYGAVKGMVYDTNDSL